MPSLTRRMVPLQNLPERQEVVKRMIAGKGPCPKDTTSLFRTWLLEDGHAVSHLEGELHIYYSFAKSELLRGGGGLSMS